MLGLPDREGSRGERGCTSAGSDKLGRVCFSLFEVIHRGVESGEILSGTAKDVVSPKGKIPEISLTSVENPKSIPMAIIPTKKIRRYSIPR